MLIICNNLSTHNQDINEAVQNKDSQKIKDIISQAVESGFNALELDATNSTNEAEALHFLLDQVDNPELTLVIKIKNPATYDQVIPSMKRSGILNPVDITLDQADTVFPMLKRLEDDWKVLFTQDYGEDTVSNEIEGSKKVIAKAEQEGILPERIYVEPLTQPIKTNNNTYIKMKRILDAFSNVYPSMNYYINLLLAADGLKDEVILVNDFISMSIQIGVEAFSLDLDHKEHIETINAAIALLNQNGGISAYLKK